MHSNTCVSGVQQWLMQAGKSLSRSGEAAARLCVVSACPLCPLLSPLDLRLVKHFSSCWWWREVVQSVGGCFGGLQRPVLVRNRATNSTAGCVSQSPPSRERKSFTVNFSSFFHPLQLHKNIIYSCCYCATLWASFVNRQFSPAWHCSSGIYFD